MLTPLPISIYCQKGMNDTNEEYHCAFHSSYRREMNTSILIDKPSIVVVYDCYAAELAELLVVDLAATEEDQNHHLKPWEYQV